MVTYKTKQYKSLNWGAEIFKKVNFKFEDLKEFGFKEIRLKYKIYYFHKRKNIIIKQSYITSSEINEKYIVPSILFGNGAHTFQYVVQFKCNTKNKLKAYERLLKIDDLLKYDLKTRNVGHYRNKSVFFDW